MNKEKKRDGDELILSSMEGNRDKSEPKKVEHKKRKREKKKKKKKKRKKEKRSYSSASNSSSSRDEWVVKPVEQDGEKLSETQRDEWMTLPGLFPCATREVLKPRKPSKQEEEKQKNKYMLDTLGQSNRELNPYWKDGGSGLPENRPVEVSLASTGVGDGGATWLQRALQRAKQQAAEEGRSLEEVAAERWGSLQKLESLLAEAEKKRNPDQRTNYRHRREDDRRHGDRHKHELPRQGGFRRPDSRDKTSYSSSSERSHSGKKNWRKDSGGMDDNPSKEGHPEMERLQSGKKDWRKNSEVVDDKPSTEESCPETSSSPHSESNEDALTEQEMNELGAKLIKAELLGNESLAAELKNRLERARAANSKAKAVPSSQKPEEETVILTKTDSRGFVRPLQQPTMVEPSGGRRKNQKVETHVDGKRVRYFADDDKYSLQDMFEREKLNTVEDQNQAFCKMAAKEMHGRDSQFDMDDIFAERAQRKESEGKQLMREREHAIKEHKRVNRALDNCNMCFNSKLMMKHLLVAMGSKAYLSLPAHRSLTDGHCLIVPMFHVPCATQLDEDVWEEIQTFKKTLTTMFLKMNQDVVFFESAMRLGQFPHMVLECIPIPMEMGGMTPAYFKKAILECEMEWSTNKKLVDLDQKDVRRSVPKGLPYFAVSFGSHGGFAHVIENEKLFPQNFAQEIIGGMLDLDHSIWRKQRKENFDVQCKKVMQFTQWWKPFNFTRKKDNPDELTPVLPI